MTKVHAHKGDTVMLWKDKWKEQCLQDRYPELHSFTKYDMISIFNVCGYGELLDLFNLPLSHTAYHQYNELTEQIQEY